MWARSAHPDDAGMRSATTPRVLLLSVLLAAVVAAFLWPDAPEAVADQAASIVPEALRPSPTTTVATGLDPGLVAAFGAARAAAAGAGHDLVINSGYRTAEHQARLLEEAVDEHGSLEAALRWVFTPERSMHVRGLAVDVGDGDAATWLDRHGGAFGLCRTLEWEWWHFEWRPGWEAAGTCPAPVDDPADAPTA